MICRRCRRGDHNQCAGSAWTEGYGLCDCWASHEYAEPDPELPDPYHTDAAEDAYLDSLIGERFRS
jgi:hypothetical protein